MDSEKFKENKSKKFFWRGKTWNTNRFFFFKKKVYLGILILLESEEKEKAQMISSSTENGYIFINLKLKEHIYKVSSSNPAIRMHRESASHRYP